MSSSNTGIEDRAVRLVYLWDVKRQSGSEGGWMTDGVSLISGASI